VIHDEVEIPREDYLATITENVETHKSHKGE
jgi:hypothetical protein